MKLTQESLFQVDEEKKALEEKVQQYKEKIDKDMKLFGNATEDSFQNAFDQVKFCNHNITMRVGPLGLAKLESSIVDGNFCEYDL